MYVSTRSLGVTAPFACPPCAYYSGDHCVWCPDDAAEIPGCEGCKDRERERGSWYASPEFLIPVASAVVATLASALLLSKLRLR
jgi:hypothetical protein